MTIRIKADIVLRWAARILGIPIIGVAVLFAVGEGAGLGDLDAVTGSMMATLLVSLAGMLVLWRWELVGGIVVLTGMGGFYAIEYVASGHLPTDWVFPVFFAPGVLALASWSAGGANQRLNQTERPD